MKDFEIFKPEDFKSVVPGERLLAYSLACTIANRILNERGKRGYGGKIGEDNRKWDEFYIGAITDVKNPTDTHQALVFLREIEEPKEKCYLDHSVVYTYLKLKELDADLPDGLGISMTCPNCKVSVDKK